MMKQTDGLKRYRRLLMWVFMSMMIFAMGITSIHSVFAASPSAGATSSGAVYVIPIDREIENGLQKFLARGLQEAEQNKASWVLLEMSTPGGEVRAAEGIGQMIRNSAVPTAVLVQDRAASAGSYIALNADKIYMQPGSMIGAAAVVDGKGQPINDAKLVAYWKSEMRSAAQLNSRNPDIAAGMTDVNMTVAMPEIDQTKEKGQIISLTAQEAQKVGYAEGVVSSVNEAVAALGHSPADIVRVEPSIGENIARFLTNPIVATILLFIGIAGIAIEILVPGFGIPGIIGVVAFGLYFFGGYAAGFSGSETWILFGVGLVLLILEVFIPSFGILGVLGAASLITGVVKAAYDTSNALLSLGIAFGVAAIFVSIVAVIFKERGIWNRFILKEQLSSDQNYMSNLQREQLLGLEGVSLTPLRPSGTIIVDGQHLDVVTQGVYIDKNCPVRIIRIDGSRIIVDEKAEDTEPDVHGSIGPLI
ncbi:NfeD family protein [Paenibacillus wulumuqiensis]|uniref:NfeD family protein n=1 Tax=Paenibacillus wulumuqiensis TaxID=1567107 RepID=UPI000619D541|nr:nodulation protein NfeD [Paenibacillus wulumuqiensis]